MVLNVQIHNSHKSNEVTHLYIIGYGSGGKREEDRLSAVVIVLAIPRDRNIRKKENEKPVKALHCKAQTLHRYH